MTQRYGGRYPDEARFEGERLDEQGERIRYGEHGSMRLGSAYRGAQDARGFYEGGSRSGASSRFEQGGRSWGDRGPEYGPPRDEGQQRRYEFGSGDHPHFEDGDDGPRDRARARDDGGWRSSALGREDAGYFGVGGLGERDRGIRARDRAAHDAWSRSAPRGPHWGKSPRGYQRSDERIREDVCDRLMHGHVDPSGVTVRVQDGDVTLEGHVTSREEKRLVEEIAEEVLGVKDVENRLKVGARAEPAASDRTQDKGASRSPNGTERH